MKTVKEIIQNSDIVALVKAYQSWTCSYYTAEDDLRAAAEVARKTLQYVVSSKQAMDADPRLVVLTENKPEEINAYYFREGSIEKDFQPIYDWDNVSFYYNEAIAHPEDIDFYKLSPLELIRLSFHQISPAPIKVTEDIDLYLSCRVPDEPLAVGFPDVLFIHCCELWLNREKPAQHESDDVFDENFAEKFREELETEISLYHSLKRSFCCLTGATRWWPEAHVMQLREEPFLAIESGKKRFELRLFDEKRARIRVGDSISFFIQNSEKSVKTRVIGLHTFATFAELYANLPLLECGYDEKSVSTASPSDMNKYYSEEEQAHYGVIAIELEVVN